MAKTAQITPVDFHKAFKKHYDQGRSTVYIGFSSGMSGTFNNAVLAKQMIQEEHPDAIIDIIDSHSASIGQGVLCMKAINMIKSNASQNVIVDWVQDNKNEYTTLVCSVRFNVLKEWWQNTCFYCSCRNPFKM